MTIWGSRGRDVLLAFTRRMWHELMAELRRRGDGRRESGAFLLARVVGDRRKVARVIYLDDLDPNCLNGGIKLQGLAYSKLWDICAEAGLLVVGDVHTHPGSWVNQSSIDADNPMVAQRGHVALIVPYLASRHVAPKDVGVHLYQGEDGWTTWTGYAAAKRLKVNRWL
jgi:proteasome lid subunit RPN8/RPN11